MRSDVCLAAFSPLPPASGRILRRFPMLNTMCGRRRRHTCKMPFSVWLLPQLYPPLLSNGALQSRTGASAEPSLAGDPNAAVQRRRCTVGRLNLVFYVRDVLQRTAGAEATAAPRQPGGERRQRSLCYFAEQGLDVACLIGHRVLAEVKGLVHEERWLVDGRHRPAVFCKRAQRGRA